MDDFEKRESHSHCSFCGKSQEEVSKLIAGPEVYICDECIDLCNEIVKDEEAASASAGLEMRGPLSNPWRSRPISMSM